MKINAVWEGQHKFVATGETGFSVLMDTGVTDGGEGKGPKPLELPLMGLAGCSGVDVVAILKKMREPMKSLKIEIDSERNPIEPKRFTSIRLLFQVEGEVKPTSLEKAIRLSLEKYCSVSNSLNAKITYAYEVNGQRYPQEGYLD
ncbi:Protein YhfA [Sporomusa rhizae]|uniref:OsmC family protein n=1 Tax=Sporomusa rhizae TaxID=357999 RepID=UPI00352B6AB8